MHRSVRWVRLLALVPLLQFAACATINTGVDPFAKQANVKGGARIYLRGNTEGVTVYNDKGEQLKVLMVNDPTFGQALGNELARVSAEQTGQATYKTKERYSPAFFVSPKTDHKLRLVRRDGSSVIVERNGKIGKKYFVIDWLLVAPTLGLSLGIDWMTGQWKDFEEINVDTEFQKAAAASTGNRR